MKENLKEIKQATLANNCPECYANDTLSLTFYQKNIKSAFFKRATDEISNSIICQKCNSTIYPVQWTEDIERVYDFYFKSLEPEKPSFKLTGLSKWLIIFTILVVAATVIAINLQGGFKELLGFF